MEVAMLVHLMIYTKHTPSGNPRKLLLTYDTEDNNCIKKVTQFSYREPKEINTAIQRLEVVFREYKHYLYIGKHSTEIEFEDLG